MSMFRNLMCAQKKGGILPAGYTQLEYVESTGTQYIFIQQPTFTKNQVIGCEFTLLGFVGSNTRGFLFGDNLNVAVEGVMAFVPDLYQFGKYRASGASAPKNVKSTLVLKDGSLELNGSLYFIQRTTGTFSQAINLFGNSDTRKFVGYMYSFTLRDDDGDVLNLIPCINPSNEVGMYDLVSQQFFGNRGTGVFIAGPVIA